MATKPTQDTSQATKKQVRKPPFSDWPTIKILTPPKGRYSQERDQFCFTYCSQSVAGRVSGSGPFCRSICFRKVFPHEVRNIVSFKQHSNIGPDGVAKYPLPAPGQPENLPRIFGGKPPPPPDDESLPAPPPEPNHWHEGWYVWTAGTFAGMVNQMNHMNRDLETHQNRRRKLEMMKDIWDQYQEYLRANPNGPQPGPDGKPHLFWGPKPPLEPPPMFENEAALLIPVPPPLPSLSERINKLLEPTLKVMDITRTSFESGEQLQFLHRVWDKAWSKEPFILAGKTFEKAGELWRERGNSDPDEDEKKRP